MTRGMTAEEIGQLRDFRVQSVDVPEWGGTCYVRSLSLRDAQVFQDVSAGAARGTFTTEDICKIVALTLCDEQGNRLFSQEQLDVLLERNFQAVKRLFDASMQVVGLTASGVAQEKKD